MIKLIKPSIDDDDLLAVSKIISSGNLIQGEQVKEFEQKITEFVGCKYAIAVTNCTSALHLSLLALGVQQSDLVLVTNYSWIATANVIELCGATPIFIDIDPNTFNMDPKILSDKLKYLISNPVLKHRIKAIIPVHTFGQVSNMPEIMNIANSYNIPVIEDAACALGATLNKKKAGTWGIMNCFSFHPRKAITTGEGGIIVTNDSLLADKLRMLRNHGLDPNSQKPDFMIPGYNCRMTEFQVALGITQLRKIDKINIKKRILALNYTKLLENTCIQTPIEISGSQSIYQSYVILLPESKIRDKIIIQLKESGIETTIGTIHIPLTTYYKQKYNYKKGDFPIADNIADRSLTLPLYESLTGNEQKLIIKKLLSLI